MDKEIYESLRDIINPLKYSMKTNDFSYWILNPNQANPNIRKIEHWLDGVVKEYGIMEE